MGEGSRTTWVMMILLYDDTFHLNGGYKLKSIHTNDDFVLEMTSIIDQVRNTGTPSQILSALVRNSYQQLSACGYSDKIKSISAAEKCTIVY